MPCKYVRVPCRSCGHYACTAVLPAKRIGSKRLIGMICNDEVPDCPIYEAAVLMEENS